MADKSAGEGEAATSSLSVLEDADTGDRFLIYHGKDGRSVALRVEGDTFWATQRQMADAFGVTSQNVTMHLGNVFREGELVEAAVCKESLHTAADGKRYAVKLYDLNALISVGYRIGGPLGTAFRMWATDTLFRYLTKGFVVDVRRLKDPAAHDRLAELREIIRDIRSDEANLYAELRRICSLCRDYDPAAQAAREFFTRMQAKLYWATLSQTPSMVIAERADAAAPDMGLRSWPREAIRQVDAGVAKNYLTEAELRDLNRVTSILLDVFEDQLELGRLTSMKDVTALLDNQLKGLNRPVLRHGGSVAAADAERLAKGAYRLFDAEQRAVRLQEAQDGLAALKAADKALPRTRKSRTPP